MAYRRDNNLFEQSGIGGYRESGDWTWEFYPPPYDFLAPPDSVAQPAPVLYPHDGHGMGGCGCGGSCGGCGDHGMGQTTGPGLFGTGLFVSMDPSTWGWGEYSVIGAGAYLLLSDRFRVTDRAKRSRRAAKAF